MAAETFGVTASALAVVELSAKVVQKFTQYTQGVLGAKADIERITGEVKGLGELALTIKRLSDEHPGKLKTLQEQEPLFKQCHSRLGEIEESLGPGVRPGKRYKAMSRLGAQALMWPFKSKDTEKIITDVHRLTQLLSDAMQVDQTAILLDMDQRAVLEKLPVADGAAYDSYANEHNPQCLPNTRVEVLREISQWAEDPSTRPVFWLNGMAGTGKSTISRTLAFVHDKKGGLGASFFFQRGEGDRGEMSKLLTTIASQMVQQIPTMPKYVQEALEKSEGICSKTLREQFSALIEEPISQIESEDGTQATRLIIIDALDECDRHDDITTLIELLAGTPNPGKKPPTGKNPPKFLLKFFLTGRPEVPTRFGFNAIHGRCHNLILHDVAELVIEHDVTAYFKYELSKIRDKFNKIVSRDGRLLPAEWPTEVEITILVEMAVPLFIFAATVCRFISDTRVGRPDRLLERVLHYRTKSQDSKLDATYLPVLTQMVDGLSSSQLGIVTKRFRQVVGSIVTLANPLPTPSLAHLLDLSVDTIDEALWTLHSVLFIPKSREQPVRMLHLSFRDFLVNPERCEDPFWINEKETHHELALNCLRVLKNSLKTDLCEVRDPGVLKQQVPLYKINAQIPPELRYACRYWVFHVQESAMVDTYTQNLEELFSAHFLQWLEALGWIGGIHQTPDMFKSLQSMFTAKSDKRILSMLECSRNFTEAVRERIAKSPLQAHLLGSAITPINTFIRDTRHEGLAWWAFLGSYGCSLPGRCLQTLKIHSKSIKTVAFSPDGKLMALAPVEDAVAICSVETGKNLQMLRGHSESVNVTVFSPDSKFVASASADTTVILWSAETGQRLQTLTEHSGSVDALAFSPCGRYFASVSAGTGLIIWETYTSGPLTGKQRDQDLGLRFYDFGKGFPKATSGITNVILDMQTCRVQSYRTGCIGLWRTNAIPSSMAMADNDAPQPSGWTSSSDITEVLWGSDLSDDHHTVNHTSQISSIVFSPDGELAVSTASKVVSILWAGNPCEGRQKSENSSHVTLMAFSPGSGFLGYIKR